MTLLMREQENIEKGIERGIKQGIEQVNDLNMILLEQNRTEDLKREIGRASCRERVSA